MPREIGQDSYRRTANSAIRHSLLGRRAPWFWRQSHAEGPQGVHSSVSHRRRWLKSCGKYTIGLYGRVTLHHARVAAQKVFAARLDGRDPAAEKREKKRRVVADRVE